MDRNPIWVISILTILIFPLANSVEDEVKRSLVQFMNKLSPGNVPRGGKWGWNINSDPCTDSWQDTLEVLSLNNNSITGLIPEDIGNCHQLSHLYLRGNRLSGDLPDSLSKLGNMKRLDLAYNNFYGELPDWSRISGLISLLAQNNRLSGRIPDFDFSNIEEFDVSSNNLSGPIPNGLGHFSADSFAGNPELCGKPLSTACSPSLSYNTKPKRSIDNQFLIYSGYMVLGLLVVVILIFKYFCKGKHKEVEKRNLVKKDEVANASSYKTSSVSAELLVSRESKIENKSDYSITSTEDRKTPTLTVLSTMKGKGLTFEDLLRAPAELIGKGDHGSVYKVMINDGLTLAVKRIKDWEISSENFHRRMSKINQVKHPNVLSPVAFYCSKEEKLVVYEYQQNGSVFELLHGSNNGQVFSWGCRLTVATYIAEALVFMYKELQQDGIAHGNLKSSNILFNNNMDPCISEYGLMVVQNQDQSFISPINGFTNNDINRDIFKTDVYACGVILLELLTGKVQKREFNLAMWVQKAVREEWTTEIFDEELILEGANEERMVNLLRVALKCLSPCPDERPSISQVAVMLNFLKEEEDKSISFNP